MKGLIIKSPWIEYILSGKKVWEIRGNNTKIRGKILLIKSGSGMILGSAELVDCIELSFEQYKNSYNNHRIPMDSVTRMPYKRTYAWVLDNTCYYDTPKKYNHPQGAVIWVNIYDEE